VSSDERDSLCEKSPLQQLQDLLRLLWYDATMRRLGMMESVSNEDADSKRLRYSMLARKFQRGAWHVVRPLMKAKNLA
jgi:hypothetical protein